MRTGKWHGRAIAWSVVVAWHALVAWWLLHGMRVPRGSDTDALVVIQLAPPDRPPPSPKPRAATPGPLVVAAKEAAVAGPARVSTPAATPPVTSTSSVLEQVHARVEAGNPVAFARPDPFASRRTRHSSAPPERFRMHARITPAQVLAGVGKIIGGPGYVADPCPRHRRNIERLLAAGDSPELRMELDYERDYCRP